MKKILGLFLGLGFGFRLLFLGKRQLWTDELMQALVVRAGSVVDILKGLRQGLWLHSPLDCIVQKGFTLILGDSAWALRFHAVVFGTLSLWLFYRISRLMFGDRVALYSLFLLVFYPLLYHYSQEGRPYALFVFLTLLSYDMLLNTVAGRKTGWPWFLLLFCVSVLLLYSSFLGVLVLVSQCIALVASIWLGRGEAKSRGQEDGEGAMPEIPVPRWSVVSLYFVVVLAACAVFVPWVRFGWVKPSIAPASVVADARLILRMLKEFGDNSYPMTGLLLLGVGTGIHALILHRRHHSLVWLVSWMAISVPAVLFLGVWSGYFFTARNILHTTPAFVLLAGYGISHVGEQMTILERPPSRPTSPALAYAGLMFLISIWIAQSHWRAEPVDWMGTAAYLRETLKPGDAIAMPQIEALLEFYAPSLEMARVESLDPGPLPKERIEKYRDIVVCYDRLTPDPCAAFRAAAPKNPAWKKTQLKTFTIFMREEGH